MMTKMLYDSIAYPHKGLKRFFFNFFWLPLEIYTIPHVSPRGTFGVSHIRTTLDARIASVSIVDSSTTNTTRPISLTERRSQRDTMMRMT
ncbi:unnamed protein product [Microthlaspi erraticum]|uniref:Uncharacterized protein n=1 Tax=Microthlaspi erraticum TaxID=1685480 RepID=A0A6D2JPV0_9BRAS|nr:unnamed protein product [Microthlaspi erraticum]